MIIRLEIGDFGEMKTNVILFQRELWLVIKGLKLAAVWYKITLNFAIRDDMNELARQLQVVYDNNFIKSK